MNIKTVSSPQNPVYKADLKLKRAAHARKEDVFIVEGVRAVEELVKAKGWTIREAFVSQNKEEAMKPLLEAMGDVPILSVPYDMLQNLSETQTPQGILAVVKRRHFNAEGIVDSLLRTKLNPFLILLENLQDPGNVGTILRSADAMGAQIVLVSKDTCDVYSGKVVRAAMGSLLHLPVCEIDSVPQTADMLHSRGIKLTAGHLKGTKASFEADLTGPVCLMIGNEGSGLSEEASRAADQLVRIPMPGHAESLNAAMAAGMLMYETVRQRSIHA